MTEVAIGVRFLQAAALLLQLGIFAFVCLVGRPAFQRTKAPVEAADQFETLLFQIAAWCLPVIFVSGLAAFVLQAAVMTGRPLAQVFTWETMTAVLATQYGKAWLLRQALLIALGGVLLRLLRARPRPKFLIYAGFALAGALPASLALAGHAAAGEGATLVLQLASDALHLLAAGMWLGALIPLALLLGRCRRSGALGAAIAAQEATRRFSWLGIATVTTLLMTGTFNAWQLVGDIAPLVGTSYGRLLLIKLALLVPLLGLAATNLLSIRPRLLASHREESKALIDKLRRNALAEAAIGGGVLVIVAMLGVTAPARHVPPDWPFAFRFSWEINKNLPEKRFPIFAGKNFPDQSVSILIGAGLAAAALLLFGYALSRRRHRRWVVGTGLGSLATGAALALPALSVDAYPTTYRRPSVPYQTISVANGQQQYRQLCTPCHGVGGFGDGPAAADLNPKPANLTAKHTGDHTAGDLFWWLSHGKPNTAMPGFKDNLDEEARWDMINYLRALSAAEQARQMAPLIEPPWLVAPDFVYQTLRGQHKSLKQHRGQSVVLLVLFTWPESQARLDQLQALQDKLSAASVTILAVPRDVAALDAATRTILQARDIDVAVDGSEEAFATFSMFRRSPNTGTVADPPVPAHMELLIDRQGYIRARWIAGESRGWMNTDILLREIAQLNQEKPSAPAPDDHVH